jgi:hypothetical protein
MKTATLLCLTLCAWISACGGEPATEQPTTTADDQPAPPPADTPDVAQRFAGRVPAEVRVRRRACPFECCTYGQWIARAELPVFATERGEGTPLFTIPVGQSFRADSGNVHITGILVVAVADSVADHPYWAFGPGDSLVVLDHVGEGHYNVWHEGRVTEVAGFWGAESQRLVAETIGQWQSEWWVHVSLEDGRTGWIRAEATTVSGADRCA